MEEWAKIATIVCANLVKIYRKCFTSVIANQDNIAKYQGELLLMTKYIYLHYTNNVFNNHMM